MLQADNYINIPKLDIDSIYIAGYADAGFTNNEDLSSQLGFIVILKDKHNNAAIIHYGSWKCYRVTRSVLGTEIYAFSHCLDFVIASSHDLSTILQRKVETIMFTDSKSLFDTITSLSTISQKQLLIKVTRIETCRMSLMYLQDAISQMSSPNLKLTNYAAAPRHDHWKTQSSN